MKVLVTGFDPFGGESINPAYEAVKMLPDEIAGAQIIKREIPTSFTRGTAEVVRQIELCQPDLVLNVNFSRNTLTEPDYLAQVDKIFAETGVDPRRLIFEITENERVVDKDHLKRILQEYRRRGFKTAIDDFGAGYSGLNLLAEFQPDIIKLDMELVRHIDTNPVRHAIVQGILGVCKALSIEVIAEGVETLAEYRTLRALGIHYFQGYLFAKPAFEQLPAIYWPEDTEA